MLRDWLHSLNFWQDGVNHIQGMIWISSDGYVVCTTCFWFITKLEYYSYVILDIIGGPTYIEIVDYKTQKTIGERIQI